MFGLNWDQADSMGNGEVQQLPDVDDDPADNVAMDEAEQMVNVDSDPTDVAMDEAQENVQKKSANIFSSTNFSPVSSGHFCSVDLSEVSIRFEESDATRQVIEQQLREAAVRLDEFHGKIFPPPPKKTDHRIDIDETSLSLNGPLSAGFMAPNISNPENMLNSPDRELITIHHTV